MKKDTIFTRLYYGVIKENPIIVLALGLCPALAVSATAKNGLAMGVFTSVVLIVSNFFISLFKRLLPKGEKILLYVFLIASFTIVAQLFLKAYFLEVIFSIKDHNSAGLICAGIIAIVSFTIMFAGEMIQELLKGIL